MLRTLRRTPREAGAALLGRYARVVAVLLASIIATGVGGSLRRIPPDTAGHDPGPADIDGVRPGNAASVLLVAVAAVLALSARLRRAHPTRSTPPTRHARRWWRWARSSRSPDC